MKQYCRNGNEQAGHDTSYHPSHERKALWFGAHKDSVLEPIKDNIEKDPDHIDEVPVETDIRKSHMALRSKCPACDLKEKTPKNQQHPNTDMGSMKSCERKET
jgi:hypothetical protein